MNINENSSTESKDIKPLYLIYGLIAFIIFFTLMIFTFCFFIKLKLFKKNKYQNKKSVLSINRVSRRSNSKKKENTSNDKNADDLNVVSLKLKNNSSKKGIESKEMKKSSTNNKTSKEKNSKLSKEKNSKILKNKNSKILKSNNSNTLKEKSSKKFNSNKSLKSKSLKDLKTESTIKNQKSFISLKNYKPSLISQKNLSSSILFFNTTPISLDHSKLNHSRTSFAPSSINSKLPKQSELSINSSINPALTKSSSNIESFTSINNLSKCNHKTK